MAHTIKRALFGVLGAAVVTSVVAAQTPETSQTPPRATTATQDRMAADDDGATVTVTGCLKEEADVPGFEPNVAERAGILEDFILTNARVNTGTASASARSSSGASSGSSSAGASGDSSSAASDAAQGAAGSAERSGSGAASAAAGGSASSGSQRSSSASLGAMYKVEGLDDDELREHANHQVEIRGKVSGAPTPSSAGADSSQRDADDVPELEAESIRMIAATCSPS